MNNPIGQQRRTVLLALDFYDYRLHKGVNQVAAQQGWNLVCTQNIAGAQAVPTGWQGDGMITLEATQVSRQILATLPLPRIELGLEPSVQPLIRVVPDNQKLAELATEYFIQRGVRSFVVEPGTHGFRMLELRKQAMLDALLHLQVTGLPITIHVLDTEQRNEQLKAIPKPAAFLGYDDEMAMNFINAVRQLGMDVPQDFLVLGIDNNDLLCEGLDITLSSIDTDQIGVGQKAAQKLAELFDETSPLAQQFAELSEDRLFLHQPKKIITRRSSDVFAASHPVVNRALNIITESLQANSGEAEYRAIPNAHQLAEILGLTQQGLQNIFREHYHCSPATAIRQLSLRHAQDMLREPETSLKQVAFQTGFSSPESLSRCFKQAFGVSPGKWRSSQI